MDYYIPLKSEPRVDLVPVLRAEIIAPVIAGGTLEFHREDIGYGAFVAIIDKNGVMIAKTGHGDIRKAEKWHCTDIVKYRLSITIYTLLYL